MAKIKAIALDFVGVLVRENDFELDGIDSILERQFGNINNDLDYLEWAKKATNLSEPEIIGRVERITKNIYELKDPLIFKRLESFRLGLATNHLSYISKWISAHGYDNIFEVIVNSSTAGVTKPSREFYQKLISDFNLKAEQILFVDDCEENILGAKSEGLEVLHFTKDSGILSEQILNKIIVTGN